MAAITDLDYILIVDLGEYGSLHLSRFHSDPVQ